MICKESISLASDHCKSRKQFRNNDILKYIILLVSIKLTNFTMELSSF